MKLLKNIYIHEIVKKSKMRSASSSGLTTLRFTVIHTHFLVCITHTNTKNVSD